MNYYDFLNSNLSLAFGCTEPVAIGYCAAKAASVFEGEIEEIDVIASSNIIKNAKSVKVPGLEGRIGIENCAVAGAILGDSEKELLVFENIKKDRLKEIDEFLKNKKVIVKQKEDFAGVYIKVTLKNEGKKASVTIENEHTNIVEIVKDEKTILSKQRHELTERERMDFSFDKIYEFAKNCDVEKLKYVLDREIETNLKIAHEGINEDWELNISDVIMEKENKDIKDLIIAYTSSAADARMSGCELPVVINAGSGDQGLTLSIPVIIYAMHKNIDRELFYRGLIFANLLGFYQKEGIGKLSAYCGTVTAAAAAISGISFMNEDDKEITANTLSNALAVISGMICDGAKCSCAVKIAASVHNALLCYDIAKEGKYFKSGDGIVKDNIDETIKTVGNIARCGMRKTDTVILDEMLR
ncbi:MAG: L-serine ammonia-lyase, iron-sulfur-dependent, subunit alpha [Tissierellia bacterium]|nr:L-serine ammonia-lyase, iron-sulfur-dependent, subunit alpha [Tissierellia bacterium]